MKAGLDADMMADVATEAVECWLGQGAEEAANRFNGYRLGEAAR